MDARQFSLLIVEDDKRLALLIQKYFIRAGFTVSTVTNGEAAIKYCHKSRPDIILLDLMLPGMDGIAVCRELRAFYNGSILMLTASGNDMDQVAGLETGADDYAIKPVEPRVLLARVRALLRRYQSDTSINADKSRDSVMQFGHLIIDMAAQSVSLRQQTISLTTHEYELLCLLAEQAGKVLTRDDIYTRLRGFGYDGTDRAVDIKVSRLRRKLGDDANDPGCIKTIWGKGYLFVPNAWHD